MLLQKSIIESAVTSRGIDFISDLSTDPWEDIEPCHPESCSWLPDIYKCRILCANRLHHHVQNRLRKCSVGPMLGKICWSHLSSEVSIMLPQTNSVNLGNWWYYALSWNKTSFIGYMESMNRCEWLRIGAKQRSLSNNMFKQTNRHNPYHKHILHHYRTNTSPHGASLTPGIHDLMWPASHSNPIISLIQLKMWLVHTLLEFCVPISDVTMSTGYASATSWIRCDLDKCCLTVTADSSS